MTSAGLAVTYTWGGRVLLAECDPGNGGVLAGFLAGQMEVAHGGLLDLALSITHNPNPAILWEHVISLDQDVREWLLLPGLKDPRHAAQLDWEAIADVLRAATTDAVDVVADVGQIGRPDTPWRLIADSDLAVMMLRPTLRQAMAAKPRLEALARYLGTSVPVSLCLIGRGEYTSKEISNLLFGLPVIGTLPHNPRSAAVLSDGRRTRRSIRVSSLMRGAHSLAIAMRDQVEQKGDRVDEQLAP